MSSADFSRRPVLQALAVASASALLAGCFTPLYGDPNVVPGARAAHLQLRELDVPEIPGRSGVILRNELIYLTQGGGGRAQNPAHVLKVNLSIDTVPLLLNTAAGRPSAQTVSLTANYTITPVGANATETLFRGTASASASFDRNSQRLASDRAIIEAQERAAKALAENIVTQVAGWYATRPR